MTEKKLDLNPLEARGVFFLQQGVLQLSQQVEQIQMQLRETEVAAEKALAGRVPEGVTIRTLRVDQRTSEVFYTAAE